MFDWQARIIRRRPALVVIAVGAVTFALLAGYFVQDTEPAPVIAITESFLPDDSELATARAVIDESFPATAGVELVQIVALGDVLAPESLQAIRDLQIAIISDPEVAPFITTEPLFGYVQIIEALLARDGQNLATASRATIEATLDFAESTPALAEATAGLDRFVSRDEAGGAHAGLSLISLNDAGDRLGLGAAQLRAHEIADATDLGHISVSLFSLARSSADFEESRVSSTYLMTILATAVIIVLLAIFYRTGSDVVIAVTGLLITIIWTFGAVAWLSLGGVGVIEPGNSLISLVPILLIALCVDYALQTTGRYREDLRLGGVAAGEDAPGRAVFQAVRLSAVPVLLASITTAVSFLTNVASRFDPVADFAIVTGIGIVSGWLVITNFVPASRVWLDRRRVAGGRPLVTRGIAETIPGAKPFLTRAAAIIARRPIPTLAGALAVTILAAVAAFHVNTAIAINDFVPRGSDSARSIELLQENFDGGASMMTVLVESDINTVRTVRNLHDFQHALADPATRPAGVAGPPIASAVSLLEDLDSDSGLPGDNYNAAFEASLAALDLGVFSPDENVTPAWLLLQRADPEGFASVVDFRSDGPDRTIYQIPVTLDGVEATRRLTTDLETLWGGHATEMTVAGGDTLLSTITKELTDSQLISVALTTLAALAILVIYFGFGRRRPALGVLSIIPIICLVIWVLAAMWALGISYNMATALITALAIGVGVDYTTHLTHRFLEEEKGSDRVSDVLRRAMLTTGGALVASALTTALGMLVAVFAPFAPIRDLGLIVAITILLVLIATFVVLPPLLVLWSRYHRSRTDEELLIRLDALEALEAQHNPG